MNREELKRHVDWELYYSQKSRPCSKDEMFKFCKRLVVILSEKYDAEELCNEIFEQQQKAESETEEQNIKESVKILRGLGKTKSQIAKMLDIDIEEV